MAKEIYVRKISRQSLYHSNKHYVYNIYKRGDRIICICSDHKLVEELSLYGHKYLYNVVPYGDGPLTTTNICYFIMEGVRNVRRYSRNSSNKHT